MPRSECVLESGCVRVSLFMAKRNNFHFKRIWCCCRPRLRLMLETPYPPAPGLDLPFRSTSVGDVCYPFLRPKRQDPNLPSRTRSCSSVLHSGHLAPRTRSHCYCFAIVLFHRQDISLPHCVRTSLPQYIYIYILYIFRGWTKSGAGGSDGQLIDSFARSSLWFLLLYFSGTARVKLKTFAFLHGLRFVVCSIAGPFCPPPSTTLQAPA